MYYLNQLVHVKDAGYMGRGAFAIFALPVNRILYCGVFEEAEIPRSVWKAGCAIAKVAVLFGSAITAPDFNISGKLVYVINSADTDHPAQGHRQPAQYRRA